MADRVLLDKDPREFIASKLHHGSICMLALTSQEYLEKHREEQRSLAVTLKKDSSKDGKCIDSPSMTQYSQLPIFSQLTERFAAAGCTHVIEYCFLQNEELKYDSVLVIIAAKNCQLKIVQHLHYHNCPWNAIAPAAAASNGHFEVLKFLCESGCPIDSYASLVAARNGHIKVVRYLQQGNYSLHSEAIALLNSNYVANEGVVDS